MQILIYDLTLVVQTETISSNVVSFWVGKIEYSLVVLIFGSRSTVALGIVHPVERGIPSCLPICVRRHLHLFAKLSAKSNFSSKTLK